MLDILDLQLAAGFAKVNFHTLRPRRSNGCDFVCRKFALGKDVQHFTAYIARGADDDYPITHFGAFPSIDSKTAGFLRNRLSLKPVVFGVWWTCRPALFPGLYRTSVVKGKSGSVRVDLGGGRIIKKEK